MYLEYWGLEARPFESARDPRFLFKSQSVELALLKLEHVVRERQPAVLLTGAAGCGKTLLLDVFGESLARDGTPLARIDAPAMDAVDLLVAVARGFGVPKTPQARSEVLLEPLSRSLGERLKEAAEAGKRAVLILDDAQAMGDPAAFEMLKTLLEGEGSPALVLSGGDELVEKLSRMETLSQKISSRARLGPLTRTESKQYILHRLSVAGSKRGIFTASAADRIADLSRGVPRRINRLCDTALLTGFGLELAKIGPSVIDMVAADIEGPPGESTEAPPAPAP